MCLMPLSFIKVEKSCELKGGPLSETVCSGNQNLANKSEKLEL